MWGGEGWGRGVKARFWTKCSCKSRLVGGGTVAGSRDYGEAQSHYLEFQNFNMPFT